MKRVAIVTAKGLGDGLIYMTLANNFLRSNFQVTTFSTPLYELKDWFHGHEILPMPAHEEFQKVFSAFDTVVADGHSPVTATHQFGNNLILVHEKVLDKKRSFVDNLAILSYSLFKLPHCEKKNGICPPQDLQHRKFFQRVVIHPTSTESKRNWPVEKFLLLERRLKERGFDPVFCVSHKERNEWPSSPLFPKISDVAAFIYESGFMIGNDSGLGHLASSLHIPTLSLFARKGFSRLWRPGLGPGSVVTPPNFLLGSRMKQKFWKRVLSCQRVISAFELLVRADSIQKDREKNAGASFSQKA